MDSVGALTGISVKVGLAAALALAATMAVRYLHLARNGWRSQKGALRVLETAALGQQRAVHLVSVGRRTFLVASTSSHVVMLADVTDDREAASCETLPGGSRVSPSQRGFAQVLSKLLAGPSRAAPGANHAARLMAAAAALRANGQGEGVR